MEKLTKIFWDQMSDTEKFNMAEALFNGLCIANSVLDYCSGDSWEREVTKDDRIKICEIVDHYKVGHPIPETPSLSNKEKKQKKRLDKHLAKEKYQYDI